MAIMCLTGAFPVYASETSQVAIELDAETDGAEEYFPGSTAGYRLTLKNKLGPSWVRVKFRFSRKGLNAPFSDKNLMILKGWEKHGEYYYYRNLLGDLYRENPVKARNYEAVKSSKKWENVGNSYIIPALLLYRYSYI